MCTVTYYPHPDSGFSLFCNHDESCRRPTPEAPRLITENGIDIIQPRDPAGRGTWIAAQNNGIVMCTLNSPNDQGVNQRHGAKSRSRIIKALCGSQDEEELRVRFGLLNPLHFGAFRLVCIFSRPHRQDKILTWHWNGRVLNALHGLTGAQIWACPFRKEHDCECFRKNLWKTFLLNHLHATEEDLRQFHFSAGQHLNEKTVAMKSRHSQTVNISHVRVAATEIRFDYYDGLPWEKPAVQTLVMPRKTDLRDAPESVPTF